MEDIGVTLARHKQRILTLEQGMLDVKKVQTEIRSMHETLVMLTAELKHTNEHLVKTEQRIDEMDNIPKQRLQQIITAVIAALAGGVISVLISRLFS